MIKIRKELADYSKTEWDFRQVMDLTKRQE